MASDTKSKALVSLCLFMGSTISMPSFDHGSFDSGSILPLGGMLNTRPQPLEIRGVYGGRKKRYIVERDEPNACSSECRNKPLCLPTLGQIIKDCKCQQCPTGVPALDGKSCQDNCPDGTLVIPVHSPHTNPYPRAREKRQRRLLSRWPES